MSYPSQFFGFGQQRIRSLQTHTHTHTHTHTPFPAPPFPLIEPRAPALLRVQASAAEVSSTASTVFSRLPHFQPFRQLDIHFGLCFHGAIWETSPCWKHALQGLGWGDDDGLQLPEGGERWGRSHDIRTWQNHDRHFDYVWTTWKTVLKGLMPPETVPA